MSIRASLIEFWGLRPSEAIARAQAEALQHRIPYLYAIIGINMVATAYTHADANPAWLDLYLPILLLGFIIYRAFWWRRLRVETLSAAEITRLLDRLSIFGVLVGMLTSVWTLSLRQPAIADGADQAMNGTGHAVFSVGITVMSCIVLTMHLRIVATLIGMTVIGPFAAYLLTSGQVIESAIALNLVLVTAAMLYVSFSFARDFEEMLDNATSLRLLSTQNARLAAADPLTLLHNRRHFFHELEEVGESGLPFAVIVIDLDDFKQVNDIYGHAAGDEVICVVAERLQRAAPREACVARLGGDEFACIVPGDGIASIVASAEALVAACREPIRSAAFTAHIGASAGVYVSQPGHPAPVVAYERADYALVEAKRTGRDRVEVFSDVHERSIRRVSRVAHSLRSADLARELANVYQPIVGARDHQVRSFEALVRWTSPDLGPVDPGEFIPIAERTDLIYEISRHVLRTALRDAAHWPASVGIKINLSVRDLMSASQTEILAAEVATSGVAAGRVTFEVTETIFAESLDEVRANLAILRRAGCAVAIDDFGVGYSSLNYIHALAPNVIKIDRCFVTAAEGDPGTRRIIRTIVELTRNVGATSVAEGVETLEQASLLAELGCDELQGFHFSRPLPPEVAAELAHRAATGRLAQLAHAAGA